MPAAAAAGVLSPAQVAERLGIARSTLSRWRESGAFPPARRLGPNRIGWPAEDIQAWIDNRPQA